MKVPDTCRVGNHRTKKVHQVHHRFERVVDFMRDRRRHAAGGSNLLRLQQGLFDSFARGDIAQNLGRADNPAMLVSYRRNGEGDIQQLAALGAPHGLKVLDPASRADISHDNLFIGVKSSGISFRIDLPIISSAE